MDVLQAIQYIIQGWNEVTTKTIQNCWYHTEILFNSDIELDDENDDLILKELHDTFKVLHLPNAMKVEEFLTIPEEDVVFEVLEDDQIIADLVSVFKKSDEVSIDNIDEMDDSVEVPIISSNVALKSLKNIHTFLLQQEDSDECVKFVNTIEKFVKKKKLDSMQQTTINQYFN